MPRPARFTIRAASALTGINPNTLRAWERRHGLVRPERTAKGYRLYTDDDIRQLKRIRRTMEQGIPVGRVLDHLEFEPAPAAAQDDTLAPRAAKRPGRGARTVQVSFADSGLPGDTTIVLPDRGNTRTGTSLADYSDQIADAASRFDRNGLERAFSSAVGVYSLREAFYDALAPAVRRLGEKYLRDLSGIAEEHFITAFARERLLAALAGLRPLHQQPRLLCACAPGEQHELGLMLLALEFGLDGVSTVYLGADVPPRAIAHAATNAKLRAIVLSITLGAPLDALRELMRLLADSGPGVQVFAGGPAAQVHQGALRALRIEVLPPDPPHAARHTLERIGRG